MEDILDEIQARASSLTAACLKIARGKQVDNILELAILESDFKLIQYFHKAGYEFPKNACDLAVCISMFKPGLSLRILKYLRKNNCKCGISVIRTAGAAGSVKLLKFLIRIGFECDSEVMGNTIKFNRLAAFKYLENFYELYYPMDMAAEYGSLDIIKYLYESGYSWNSRICMLIAKSNIYVSEEISLACLKYVQERGCVFNSCICIKAAETGNLEVLKYARKQGCDWNYKVCLLAAVNSHLKILKYAHESGCDWNESICDMALLNENYDCLLYAYENSCPGSKNYKEDLQAAGFLEF